MEIVSVRVRMWEEKSEGGYVEINAILGSPSLYPEHLLRNRLWKVIRFFRTITETITVLALALYKPRIHAQISFYIRREQK